jgi:hypothetical protein
MFSKLMPIQLLAEIGIGVSLIASAVMLSAEKAQASFTCGPHLLTYQVRSLSGTTGTGVRCVRFRPDKNLSLYWYGEGYWGQRKYRHIGGFYKAVTSPNNAFAFDISGNGENFNGSFPDLEMTLTPPLPATPQTIQVTGAWNEEWILAPGSTIQGYTSPLGPVRNCGSNFQTYHVLGGNGIRCIKREYALWYGEGSWSGRTYSHIGIDTFVAGDFAEAVDICEPSKFSFCNIARSLNITPHLQFGPPFPYVPIRVTGDWNETWEPH